MATLKRLNDGFRYTDRGSMRDHVIILAPNPGAAPDGSPLPQIVWAINVWAYIRHIRPMEKETTGPLDQMQSMTWWDVRTPQFDEEINEQVSSQMTILSPQGEVWYVVDVSDPDKRGIEWRWTCREVNDGQQRQARMRPFAFVDGGWVRG
jgi:hypothetical protein